MGLRVQSMRQVKISPSMMCADFSDLQGCLRVFAEEGVEFLHIDVMDGTFVPNFAFGTDFVKCLRKISSIPLDIHMMVCEPENKIDWFDIQPGEFVSVHYESTPHIQRLLKHIRDLGARPMLALNPSTPLCTVEEVIDDLDAVLLMMVNPGFAGQKLIPRMLDKIFRLRNWLDSNGFNNVEIQVDGNVSFANAKLMRRAGADIFVAGSSSVFHPEYTLQSGLHTFREVISDEMETAVSE